MAAGNLNVHDAMERMRKSFDGLESTSHQMIYASESILGYGRLSTVQHIESVTAAGMQTLARTFLGIHQMALVSVGKNAYADQLRHMVL